MTDQTTINNHNEAPASWNCRFYNPQGFSCQLTLRGTNGKELLDRAEAALTWLEEVGCRPSPIKTNGNSSGNATGTSWCPIHQCEMKLWEKDGRSWYSHKTDEGWCNGKAK
jgi:hypothetical protein